MKKVEFQAWASKEGDEITFAPTENIEKLFRQGLLSFDSVLLYKFEASSYIEAMQEHHRRMDWEEYQPMLDEDGNPVGAEPFE